MSIITRTDITDDLFTQNILTDQDVVNAIRRVQDIARGKGVDPSRIPEPAPYKVFRLAWCYTIVEAGKRKWAVQPRRGQNSDGEDAYKVKANQFLREAEELEDRMVAEDFLGEMPRKKSRISIPMYRS